MTIKDLTKTWKKRFFIIWSSQIISLLSSGIIEFSIIWWITSITGSARVLSIATIITLVPKSVLNPFIGALVDRWDRRTVLIMSDLIIAACSLVLAALFFLNNIQIGHIYCALFIRSVFGCFHHNCMVSSTSFLVPKNKLTRIAGLNQSLNGLILFAAPPLGALLINISSFQLIMLMDVIGAVIAVCPLIFIKIPKPLNIEKLEHGNKIKNLLKDVGKGFKYIKNWKGAGGMLVLSTSVNFILQPVFMLVAIFVTKVLGGNEIDLGFIGAAVGLGYISGGVFLSLWQGFKRKMITSITGIIGAGIFILLIGLIPAQSFILILICFFISGLMMPICMGPIQALVQSSVSPEVQGRVYSIMTGLSNLVAPISLSIAGILFDFYSPTLWYFWGGVMVIILGVIGFSVKRIRNLSTAPAL